MGEPLPAEVVRAALAIRLNGLLRARSGVRPLVAERVGQLLNAGIVPVVPRTGSLGASGDLAPSAHAFLVLVGEGQAIDQDGGYRSGADVLRDAHVEPIELAPKEALALVNGTHFMAAIGSLLTVRCERLADTADGIAALSLEALRGEPAAFDPAVHALRPVPGQARSAAIVRALTDGSERLGTRERDLQDAYSFRCIPQVHGAAREALAFFRRLVEIDLNAVTDNPIVFDDPARVVSAGNFHGQTLALAFDTLRLALADLASISERRTFRLLSPSLNFGLPAFLTPEAGSSSGYMVVQYTAAALLSELRALAHPVSHDTVPTSDNQGDHVSMGMTGALLALESVSRLEAVLAIEALCAAQALELVPGRPGTARPRCTGSSARESRRSRGPPSRRRTSKPCVTWCPPVTSPPLSPATRRLGRSGYGRPRRPPAPRSRPRRARAHPARSTAAIFDRSSSPAFAPSSRTCVHVAMQPCATPSNASTASSARPAQLRVPEAEIAAARERVAAASSRRSDGESRTSAPSTSACSRARRGVPRSRPGSWSGRRPGRSPPPASSSRAVRAPFRPCSCTSGRPPSWPVSRTSSSSFRPPPGTGSMSTRLSLAVASELGLTTVFRANGPAGIAAAAFGTETIPKVAKIVGPGSPAVTSAQVQLQAYGCATAMLFGPSESLVIADEAADPAILAADLLNEAEHGDDSVALLVTASETLVDAVAEEIERQLAALPQPRAAYASAALSRTGGAMLVRGSRRGMRVCE